MANTYGKTWWGQKWLESLSRIDHSNRLPRGRTYANKGYVESLEFKNSKIIAQVTGSRPYPYEIEIGIPKFSKKNIEGFIKELLSKPALISGLLNGELNPAVLNIATANKLKVFPSKWDDLEMYCSCPDWAVPCKHLAAVIYKVCNEIDNDPFLAFGIHDLDLVSKLKKAGLQIRTEVSRVVQFPELLKAGKRTEISEFDEEQAYKRIDFSLIPQLDTIIPSLLADSPAFYTEGANFKPKYLKQLKSVTRAAKRISQGRLALDSISFERRTLITEINTRSQLSFKYDDKAMLVPFINNKQSDLIALICQIQEMQSDYLRDYQASVAAFHTVISYCFHLLLNGTIVPQLVEFKDNSFAIRWLPALVSKEVREIHEKIVELCPSDLIGDSRNNPIGIDHLISGILSAIMRYISSENKRYDGFEKLFFAGASYSFKGVGEQAIPSGIAKWLQRLYLSQGDYKPVLLVEEGKRSSFNLEIQISPQNQAAKKNISIKSLFRYKKYDEVRYAVLQSITPLGAFIPKLDKYINEEGEENIRFSNADFTNFLFEMIPALKLFDIDVLLPKSLQELIRPRASLAVSTPANNKSFLTIKDVLQFERRIAVGDDVLSKEDFQKLVKQSGRLIKYKTKYIYIDDKELESLFKKLNAKQTPSQFELLRSALSEEYQGVKVHIDAKVKKEIADLTKIKKLKIPKGLKASLRPYQARGYSWMYRNSKIGFGSVLADDMGLGKTIQVITFLLQCKEDGLLQKKKVLIVVPTGLLTNWEAEIEKFAPSLRSFIYHGSKRQLDGDEEFDVMLTSYGVLRSDATLLKKRNWHSLIIDEAQNIKNSATQQSRAVKSIKADNFIALSGTPVENRLSELWSIMDFANRGLLGNAKGFNKEFAAPIEVHNNQQVVDTLKKISSPFLMRRLKTDKSIISDLPDKIEIDAYAQLTNAQAALYEKTLNAAMNTIEQVNTANKKELFKRQGLILQMILALKQICNHPTQFLKNKKYNPELSGKVGLLFELIQNILDSGEKVLIFSQFKEMCVMLQQFISERFNETPLLYHGGSSIKQRKEMIDSFQNNRADRIFILSIKAAGTGLNLTAANHVIHFDLWWNPAVEAQATDRAYRIGQEKNVMVHRFITKGTFEEKINEMIQRKKSLADLTVATGEKWIGNLSNKELKEVFGS